MSSPTLKSLSYRTFDDLMNEVYVDLPSFTREGMVEPAQLIKIAQKCNFELGLKIHGTKETMLEVEHGRAKLPSDFYILNLALLCGHYRICEPGLFNGIQSENVVTPIQNPQSTPLLTTCPCIEVTTVGTVSTTYVDCQGVTKDITFQQQKDASGNIIPLVTKMCATSINTIEASCFNWTINNPTGNPASLLKAGYTACDGTASIINIPSPSITTVCSKTQPYAASGLWANIITITKGAACSPGAILPTSNCYNYTVTNTTTSSSAVYSYTDCNGSAKTVIVASSSSICSTTLPKLVGTGVGKVVKGAACPAGSITAVTKGFCYKDVSTGNFSCDAPAIDCNACLPATVDDCGTVDCDPWKQNRVFTQCSNTMQVNVIEYHSNQVREYSQFEMIHMVPSKEATVFCVNTQFPNSRHRGSIRDGFLWIPTVNNGGHSRVYICYLGAMEDADGNLLVLDHPKINDYYEWALKERILQNLHLNGEPDLLERWKIAKAELKAARAEALAITTTPDFYELRQIIEANRKAAYHKYLDPFSSLFANTPNYPWALNTRRL